MTTVVASAAATAGQSGSIPAEAQPEPSFRRVAGLWSGP